MKLTCAFATGPDTPDHVAVAESLGYQRAWLYDSPALYPDVWMQLALAATRTSTIGLGPGVLVPSLRHPVTNAAAITTLERLAPGRVAVAIGSGFTGRLVLGQRPMRWSDVAIYVRCVRKLLRGEETEWDGRVVRIADRPDRDVPIWIGADGPKGNAVADELGDGVICGGVPNTAAVKAGRPLSVLAFGTVLQPGEGLESDRVRDAAGHAMGVILHGAYERGGAEAVDGLPGGTVWREATEAVPESVRHLAIHEGHLTRANERDVLALDAGATSLLGLTLTGSPSEVAGKVDELEAAGMTEIAYQPAGPDIPGELRTFAAALLG
ncbi:MAG: flavin-dependent oxidoreductase, F420-dependent methylene-tetrahydromethanopterin reductase [Acidimicrobiales bacterium]|jgi:5,10-methylenetetrahydromethanopterin reductase|nr:flavin-dependent oxidoreductase, F420-dependent methylene-tetrahydromethanopterin reductase [Acidimicrobiales bacterium]